METTPLEALTIGPDEVLIFRLPRDHDEAFAVEVAEQVAVWAEGAGIADRVLVVSDEIELATTPDLLTGGPLAFPGRLGFGLWPFP